MKVLNFKQGTPEWLEARKNYFTASEADAMMGTSKYKSRYDLLVEKKTGVMPEFSDYVLGIFQRGHDLEEIARAKVEEQNTGFPLYTVVGTRNAKGVPLDLLASFDGYNGDKGYIWEHKTYNKHLAQHIWDREIPESHKWQLVQQCYVSGFNSVYFTASDEKHMISMTFHPTQEDYEQLLHGWRDFASDLKHFKPTEIKKVVKGVEVEHELPIVTVDRSINYVQSNIDDLKFEVQTVLSGINKKPETDEEYAQAESDVKMIKSAESRIKKMYENIREQLFEVSQLFDDFDAISDDLSKVRLILSKQVKSQKDLVRDSIIFDAKFDLLQFCADNRLEYNGDFINATKSKRTLATFTKAVDEHLAECKSKARPSLDRAFNDWAVTTQMNIHDLASLRKLLKEYGVEL